MKIPEVFRFDNHVSENFDTHVREQLPWYDLATEFTCHLSAHYLKDGGSMLDVGCSTGNITSKLKPLLSNRRIDVHSVDPSEGMKDNFNGYGSLDVSTIEDYKLGKYDVIVCMLSLMFVDIAKRDKVIKSLIDAVNVGGCIIIVDKFQSTGGYLGSAISKMTLRGKMAQGAKPEDILLKELSLIGVQRPFQFQYFKSHRFNEFFRFGDFAGFIHEKHEQTSSSRE